MSDASLIEGAARTIPNEGRFPPPAHCRRAPRTLPEAPVNRREAARILRNWKNERDSATLYRALASIERNPRLVGVFNKLAESEHEHSAYWEKRLREHGETLFATGACIPLLPFLIAARASAVVASFAVSLLALFLIGLLTSFFNRRSLVFSGLRQVGIGAAAAALTDAIGRGAAALMG